MSLRRPSGNQGLSRQVTLRTTAPRWGIDDESLVRVVAFQVRVEGYPELALGETEQGGDQLIPGGFRNPLGFSTQQTEIASILFTLSTWCLDPVKRISVPLVP